MKKQFDMAKTLLIACATAILVTMHQPVPLFAQEAKLTVRGSGEAVPRFVTLKFDKANMREGPGNEYKVLWQYNRTGFPMLVEAEFGVWRKVVDHEGTTGWMHGSLLSLRRMVLVVNGTAKIHKKPLVTAKIVAVAERGALLELQSCPAEWCRIAVGDLRGWVSRDALWGMRDGEALN